MQFGFKLLASVRKFHMNRLDLNTQKQFSMNLKFSIKEEKRGKIS